MQKNILMNIYQIRYLNQQQQQAVLNQKKSTQLPQQQQQQQPQQPRTNNFQQQQIINQSTPKIESQNLNTSVNKEHFQISQKSSKQSLNQNLPSTPKSILYNQNENNLMTKTQSPIQVINASSKSGKIIKIEHQVTLNNFKVLCLDV